MLDRVLKNDVIECFESKGNKNCEKCSFENCNKENFKKALDILKLDQEV